MQRAQNNVKAGFDVFIGMFFVVLNFAGAKERYANIRTPAYFTPANPLGGEF
jgi:hypothetical protein